MMVHITATSNKELRRETCADELQRLQNNTGYLKLSLERFSSEREDVDRLEKRKDLVTTLEVDRVTTSDKKLGDAFIATVLQFNRLEELALWWEDSCGLVRVPALLLF